MNRTSSYQKNPAWRLPETELLRKLYPTTPNQQLPAYFKGRTEAAIVKQARRLELLKAGRQPLTPAQRAAIRAEYAALGAAPLAEKLGIPKGSIWAYASGIGLRRDPVLLAKERAALASSARQAAPSTPAVCKGEQKRQAAQKRKPCGLERKAGARKAQPAPVAAKKWYNYPRGSAEYKAGEAEYFRGKQARTIADQYGRPATVYTNSANAIGSR